MAAFFLDRGVSHLHSHFGWEQADTLAYLHRLTGLPYSLTLHAADIYVDNGHLARRLHDASFVATISAFNKTLLLKRFGPMAGKIHVVHCGVDLEAQEPSPMPESRPIRVVSVGRMVAKKGFDILLQALALLRSDGLELAADLVGDGPLRSELESLTGELGLADLVRFHGALAPDQTVARIRDGHIFALACQVGPNGDMDGIPVALMEAMALGRPVVSTHLSGIPELVAGGCGLLAEPGDCRSLATRLRLLASDRDLALCMVANARKRIEQEYTLAVQARRIVDLAAMGPQGGEQ